jgi:hypothetical protein
MSAISNLASRRRIIGAALSVAACAALTTAGCAGSTGNQRIEFDARVGGIERDPKRPFAFENAAGWNIKLTQATVTLGPVYLNVAAPLDQGSVGQVAPTLRGAAGRFYEWLIPSAHASGDEFLGGGRVVGEVLGQVTFDALSPQLQYFPVRGTVTQEYVQTADVWFYPKPGENPEAEKISTQAVDVAGVAERDNVQVKFRGTLTLDASWLPDAAPGSRDAQTMSSVRKVRGIPGGFYPSEGGTLDIRFDVRALFRGADFSNLATAPTAPDGAKLLVQGKVAPKTTDQVMTNMYQGLKSSRGTYAVRWQ